MLPTVAIVGRPNVGKSSLLNLLAGRTISIVDPQAGITRDRVSITLQLPPLHRQAPDRWCELVDTGGWGLYSAESGEPVPLAESIEKQIFFAATKARVVLFVIDAQGGLTSLDRQMADLLRKKIPDRSRLLLVANKVDAARHESLSAEAASLGFGPPMSISATTGRNRPILLEKIAEMLGEEAPAEQPQEGLLLAVVGKRNAGKSTLINTLAGEERVIASEIAGTTRDSVDVRLEYEGRPLTAIDTAGLRKRKSIREDVDYYSLHRALRSVRRADVIALLIDAAEPASQVDKRLSGEIVKHHKPCMILVNKWDLVQGRATEKEFTKYLRHELRGLECSPILNIAAKTGQGVKKVLETAFSLFDQSGHRVPTGQLNQVIQQILEQRGPSSKLGTRAKILYATMPQVHPPTLALFVNQASLFDDRYQRYMINRFREMVPTYASVPIHLVIRQRRGNETEGRRPGPPQSSSRRKPAGNSRSRKSSDSSD